MVRSESKKPIIRRNTKNSQHVLLYGIFFSVFLFFVSLLKPTFFDFLNNRVYDTLLSANPGQPSPIPVIIDIDEKSLRQYGFFQLRMQFPVTTHVRKP
jgi:CHASE2 domain-containing sensor protein